MRRALALIALALAAFAAYAWLIYTEDLSRARSAATTGSIVATTACGPIEFAVAGSGNPLLVIHGAGGGFDQGLFFGQRLVDAGVQVISPSRFGYLRTPVPAEPSAQAQADAHACLLDLLGLQRVAVLGASAGAPSAMQFCIRHPQRCSALILLVPAAYAPVHAGQTMRIPPGLEWVVEHVLTADLPLWVMIKTNPRMLVRTMLGTPAEVFDAASADERAVVLETLMSVQPVSRRVAGLDIDAQITSQLPRYELERITAPTLLISLTDDLYGTWENARYTAAQIPNARFVSYARGGHIWVGHEDDVFREVMAFIK